MNFKRLLLAIGTTGCVLTLSSCLKETIDDLSEIKGAKTTNEFAMPLVSISMGMKELYESYAKSAFIHEASDKLLIFSYQTGDTVESAQNITFPAMDFGYGLKMADPAIIAAFNFTNRFDVSIDSSIAIDLPLGPDETVGKRINLVKVKQGTFTIQVINGFNHNATVTVSYPGITKNGVMLSDNIVLDYDADEVPKKVSHTFVIDDYEIDFTKGGTTYNTIPFSFDIGLSRIPSNSTSTNDSLRIDQTFNIASYKEINGYLGRFNIIAAHQSQEIDLLSGQLDGEILVNDPRLVLRVFHSYGLPVTGKISNIKVITKDGNELAVAILPFKDTFSFEKPTVPGQIATSEYKIDKTNSNLDQVLNSRPTAIEYDVDFYSNYNEIITNNYLVDGGLFRTEIDFQLPMDIKILDYVTYERASLSIGDVNLKGAEHVKLAVRTENTLPFDMFAQMLFVRDTVINGDTVDFTVDSLFNTELAITGAVVDGNGKVVSPYVSIREVTLPVKRFDKIQKYGENTVMRIRSQSSQFNGSPGFVKIYTDQKMSMKLGGKIKLILKSNDL
jgi:hypothetical protein